MTHLPDTKTPADMETLDNATAAEALKIVLSVLTNDQKNTILRNHETGSAVTVAEFAEAAILNSHILTSI